MREFQARRNTLRAVLYSRAVLLILAACVVFISFSVYNIYQKSRYAEANRREAEAQLATLKTREERLRADIKRLGTQEGIETELRGRFPIATPGEGVIQIVETEGVMATTSQPIEPAPKSSFWRRFF